ncbi:MAG: ABC transporter ATP-binding protein [Ilumatobacteraceae bacterium]
MSTPAPTHTAWTASSVLRRSVTGQRRWLTRACLLLASHQVGEALVPVVIGVVVDRAIDTGDAAALVRWLAVLAVVFGWLSLSYRFGARANVRAAYGGAHDLRVLLGERILDDRGGADRGGLPGALLNIATTDATRAGAFNSAIAGTVAAGGALLVALVAVLRVSIPLGLVVLAGAPLVLAITHVVSRPLEQRSGAEQAEAAQAAGVATDLVSGLRVLKGIGATGNAAVRYRAASRRSLAATLRAAVAEAGFDGATALLTGVFLALVALVGGRLAAEGHVSIGELIAAVGLAQFLLGPLGSLASVSGAWARAKASAGRIATVLDNPFAVTGGAGGEPPAGTSLRLDAVVLDDALGGVLDVTVERGGMLGVVVDDQATATALVELLGREVDPRNGRITVDGIDAAGLDPAVLRRIVLATPHDAVLFAGSVHDNVAVAATDATTVDAAIVAANADEVAASLSDGLATQLTESGRSLSGGQRQRIALARALAADRPVLVLHDPTSAIDAVTEASIAERLRELRGDGITVLVTTSPALLAACDEVIVIAGDTVARGTHQQLVERDPRYRELIVG